MKKINVQKLVELKNLEKAAMGWVDFHSDAVRRGWKGTDHAQELEKSRARLDEIRSQFDVESAKLSEAIKTAEGRATVRKANASSVIESLAKVSSYLGISKRAMKGTIVRIDCNAQTFPNAYKYVPQSTVILAEFTASGWTVTDIYRGTTMRKHFFVILSDTAKEAYLRNAETLGE